MWTRCASQLKIGARGCCACGSFVVLSGSWDICKKWMTVCRLIRNGVFVWFCFMKLCRFLWILYGFSKENGKSDKFTWWIGTIFNIRSGGFSFSYHLVFGIIISLSDVFHPKNRFPRYDSVLSMIFYIF